MKKNGFEIETGLAGIPTAFKAVYGSGKPVIGFLGEYDALPNLSQHAGVEYDSPLVPGGNGHGCGHNALGAGTALAVAALKKQDLFSLNYGNFENELKLFGLQEPGQINTHLIMRDGFFYISNGEASKILSLTSYGDLLSILYNSDKNPVPSFIELNGNKTVSALDHNDEIATQNAVVYPFNNIGAAAVDSGKRLYVADLLPPERCVQDESGKTITQCYSLSYNREIDASLILFKLITGKKHQIRKHSANAGHPLVGDRKYRGGNLLPTCKHYLLHAWRLDFPASRPADMPTLIEAPFFPEMKTSLKQYFSGWRKAASAILTNQTRAAGNF